MKRNLTLLRSLLVTLILLPACVPLKESQN